MSFTAHSPNDLETVLAELQAGIIPTSIFIKKLSENKDPFAGMEKQEARKMKRKWRKLKKKFGVKDKSLCHQSYEIRHRLRREGLWR
jgi:sialic acid synthase SpsE